MLASWLTDWYAGWLNAFMYWMACWLVGWLVDWLAIIGLTNTCAARLLTGWTTGWMTGYYLLSVDLLSEWLISFLWVKGKYYTKVFFCVVLLNSFITYVSQLMVPGMFGRGGAHAPWPAVEVNGNASAHATNPWTRAQTVLVTPSSLLTVTLTLVQVGLVLGAAFHFYTASCS